MPDRSTTYWHGLPLSRWLPAAVLALSLALTGALFAGSVSTHQRERQAALERQADAFAQALSGRIQSYIDTLPGLRVFGVLKSTPSDVEFKRYVEAISLQRRFPGLALTFMAERVAGPDLAAYVQSVRSDRSISPGGHPEFEVRPPGDRPAYMVLRHNHPPNDASFGYDLYDPAQGYRAAVDAAVANGGYVATGPLLLARDRFTQGQPLLTSVVIRAALYAGGQTPATPEARDRLAIGVVGISFRTTDLVRSVLPAELARAARIRITDPTAEREGPNALVFDSGWLDAATARAASETDAFRTNIKVADRRWDIAVDAHRTVSAIDGASWGLLALGLALSALLAVMTRSLVQANRLAERKIVDATAALKLERDNLESSESRYRMLFTHSLDAVMRTVPGGQVLAANPAACRLFGRSEAELQAVERTALIDLADPRVEALDAERTARGSAQGQVRLRRADGSFFEAEVASSTYTEAGGERRMVSSLIVRDVTERHALAERQAHLAAILDATPDFVGSAGLDGRTIFLNRAARRILGIDPDGGGADVVPALNIEDCHPSWAARIVLEQGIPAAARDGVWFGRTAVRAADGREIAMSQVILCHRNSRGEPTHLSTICRDLSDLERAESERQALEVRLHESQKMESIGTLAGGVAHDFNNVLAAILGNVEMSRHDLGTGHPTQQRLNLIHQAATRARSLVQQIMTFSRRSPQARSVQHLQPLVEEALALLRATLPAGVRMESMLTAEPLAALVDAAQVHQVVMNLCTNAWQAMPEQIGVVQVSLDLVAGPPASARLRVLDNGIGMDEATRLRVFEPFFTTKAVGQGTGLGLAVVHGIVTASGGTIEVRSAPGAGSCFEVRLPLAEGAAAAPASDEPARHVSRGAGEHVLYVDDDPVVAVTAQALLQREGYRVTLLASAQDALDRVRANSAEFDLVISDYNMPGMTGILLADALRALAPDLPVVITSGYVTDELCARASEVGVRAVLFKEHSLERLGSVVDSVLGGVAVKATGPVHTAERP